MEAMKLSGEIVTLPLHNANMEETIDLSRVIHSQPHSTFIFQIKGDAMAGANMPDGAMAVIDRSLRPGTGDIILAMVNGEYTIKRLVKAGRNWVLHAENAFYKPVLITEDTDFQVWGVVTAVIVDMRK
ncbi:S24 family peptidase [Chitinophaga sp. CB10]|uniref:LexA family protein n=1 Tax=Chitinophaga sp. CB10 TaxID=1891659 RepID=UPI0025C5254B|nr:S24 family peptidase [Chitinophaga sp. CB10]